MSEPQIPLWLKWAREIQAIGQTGLFFHPNDFDHGRYHRIIEIAAEIFAKQSGIPERELLADFFDQTGYATPKVDVRGAVFQDHRILLVKEHSDGRWSMPGGYADVNEAPSAMVEREIREEAGLFTRAVRFIGVYETNHEKSPLTVFHAYKLVFLCDVVDGKLTTSNETDDVDFFSMNDLPALSELRTMPRMIQDAFAAVDNLLLPSVFD